MILNLFRSHYPKQLTLTQINKLSKEIDLSPAEVEKWYQQFISSYTYGYVSYDEFVVHVKQLYMYHSNQSSPISKSFLRQLFSKLDRDQDKKLNFEEFFRFNNLVSQENDGKKLEFIMNFFDQRKDIYFTQEELIEFFINIFYLLNLTKLVEYVPEKIKKILLSINIETERNRIYWNEFSACILNHSKLFEYLLATDLKENHLL